MTNRYIDAAERYARDVLSAAVPACKWTRLAVERQQADLLRECGPDWPYVFDHERAARPCEFLELLPHIKGKWAREGRLIELEDWQCWIVTTVFGWVHAETRLRRFREGYVEVPRKNAKSTLSSGLALYMLSADGEHGAEVYSAATTRDQARIVFDDSKAMALRLPGLRDHLGVAVMQHSITVAHTASSYRPLAAEGSTLDGLNVHFAVIDELHAHKTRAVYDVIDTARGAREQALLWNITTAGTDISGICYERRTHVTKVLQGVVLDPATFGVVYTIDSGDDPQDPTCWAKANPNYGKSVLEDDMIAAARKAATMPSALNNFLTKRLNVWVNGESAWLDMRSWDGVAQPGLTTDQIPAGTPVWMGLDLAQKKDFAALAIVWQRAGMWHVCIRLYLNEFAVKESPNAYLSGWAREGHVTVTDGNVTDFDVIAADMRTLCRQHDVQEIAYDPALSAYFAGKLVEEGLPLVEIQQRAMFFTQPVLQVENLVLEKKLRHDANPAMAWMVSNTVVKVSKFNELRHPTKEREENKIDGVLAMFMALGRALSPQAKTESVYETRGMRFL
ncbi:terminase large subunit [Corticibacter populi]|uniref:Terminase large subunit n=1 Tax=Corticibacter populi TaxID=1550736 RepID=A0A3M6QW25_9BURK|nr:terminase TerL endonuclease subunit [Corticibacter populi]RMX06722.1 terminase large subunit [Corticibacter populi]RZS31697.1 phage terminase large subunit-like protein [Corticibacter populi]